MGADAGSSLPELLGRWGQEEIGRILNLKRALDHNGELLPYAARYRKMGWLLLALDARGGAELNLDFADPPKDWSRRLSALGFKGIQVNLGVRTGRPSQLLVLEIARAEGPLDLDLLGNWRAAWIAEAGQGREQHYYTLPAGCPTPPSCLLAPGVKVHGTGGLALVPPSLEPETHEPWRWLQPLDGQPLTPPRLTVWMFLQQRLPASVGSLERVT